MQVVLLTADLFSGIDSHKQSGPSPQTQSEQTSDKLARLGTVAQNCLIPRRGSEHLCRLYVVEGNAKNTFLMPSILPNDLTSLELPQPNVLVAASRH